MNYSELVSDIRFLTRTDSNEYTATDITRAINAWYYKAVDIVLESVDDWDFDDPNLGNQSYTKTYNLTANTQDINLDVLTNKILKLKRVEVTYDGTNWYKAEPMDLNEFTGAVSQSSNISGNFSTSKPYYDLTGNYLSLYPVPSANVSSGLKIWFARKVDEFTTGDTTQEPGIDIPFHRYLSLGPALDYAIGYNLENKQELGQLVADMEMKMRRYYGRKNEDRQLVFKSSFNDYN